MNNARTARQMVKDANELDARAKRAPRHHAHELRERAKRLRDAAARLIEAEADNELPFNR